MRFDGGSPSSSMLSRHQIQMQMRQLPNRISNILASVASEIEDRMAPHSAMVGPVKKNAYLVGPKRLVKRVPYVRPDWRQPLDTHL